MGCATARLRSALPLVVMRGWATAQVIDLSGLTCQPVARLSGPPRPNLKVSNVSGLTRWHTDAAEGPPKPSPGRHTDRHTVRPDRGATDDGGVPVAPRSITPASNRGRPLPRRRSCSRCATPWLHAKSRTSSRCMAGPLQVAHWSRSRRSLAGRRARWGLRRARLSPTALESWSCATSCQRRASWPDGRRVRP